MVPGEVAQGWDSAVAQCEGEGVLTYTVLWWPLWWPVFVPVWGC